MLKVEILKRYQKFWIKRSLRTKHKVETYEEFSALRLLCEGLLNDEDKQLMEEIMMDDIIERTIDTIEDATFNRLVTALQDKENPFLVNSHLHDGSTPLHVVAKAGFSDCVRLLIQNGANVNAIHGQLGHSVLHVATMVGSYKCMNHLVNAGASRTFINTMAGRRRSAIHYAAERGSAPCLLMLLNPNQGNVVQRNEELREIRAIIDLQDSFGNTALHLACVDGSEDCVKILIEAGASATVRNIEGKTPVDVARAMNGSGAVGAVLFLVLIAAGLDPMNEALAGETGPESANENTTETAATEDSFHTGRTAVSLLDDIVSEGSSSNAAVAGDGSNGHANGAAAEGLWVIVQDGMLVWSFPPSTEFFLSPHKKVDPSKISKRLRFVRRSIVASYGGDAGADETAQTEGEGENSNPNNDKAAYRKVEVFSSQAEAEDRARSFMHADVQAHKSRVTVNGLTSTLSPVNTQVGATTPAGLNSPVGAGAGATSPWGSHRRSIGGGSTSGNTVASSSSGSSHSTAAASGSSNTPAPPNTTVITAATYQPTTVYYVACIRSERVAAFKGNIPHYFPQREAPRSPNGYHQHTRPEPGPLQQNNHRSPHRNNNKSVNEETEDPMWASFKRTHSNRALKTNNYNNGDAIQDDTGHVEGAVQDTSRSNKPVKLFPATPVPRVTAPASSKPDRSAPIDSDTAAPIAVPASPQPSPSATVQGSVTIPAPAPAPVPRIRTRKQLAEEEMELSTSIATANAEIFELMCLLEELQTAQKAHLESTRGVDASLAAAELKPQPVIEDLLELHSDTPTTPSAEVADSTAGSPSAASKETVSEEHAVVAEASTTPTPVESPSAHASPTSPSPATPVLTSAPSNAPADTPMLDFKSPALRSPINILVDEAHHHGYGHGNGSTDVHVATGPGLGLDLNLEMEMEGIVLSVHDDLRMNLDMLGEGVGEGGSGINGVSISSSMLMQEEVMQVERLGDLSEESLAYLGEGPSSEQNDTLRWEEL